MKHTQRLLDIDKKLHKLQEEKKQLEHKIDQARLALLKRIGFFNQLSEAEGVGLILEGLAQIDERRGAWQTQGEHFLQGSRVKPAPAGSSSHPSPRAD